MAGPGAQEGGSGALRASVTVISTGRWSSPGYCWSARKQLGEEAELTALVAVLGAGFCGGRADMAQCHLWWQREQTVPDAGI